MKTLILLASVTCIVTAATAQHRNSSVVFNDETRKIAAIYEPEQLIERPALIRGRNNTNAASRTTGATSRWYNYGDYIATAFPYAFTASYLWNDSTSVDLYSGGHSSTLFKYNNMASVAYVCDPFFFLWNDVAAFAGMMQLTPNESYTIDSVYISGIYLRNNTKTTPVDTLTVAIIYGDGSQSSDLHYKAIDTTGGREWIYNQFNVDTLHYMNMKHDSANNHADTFMGGFAPVVKKFYLTNMDTSSNYELVIPVSINVPAGHMPAVSVSFKSGDPDFVAGDTVFFGATSATPYKYGMFRPFIVYEGSPAVASFPVNVRGDMNEGQFRDVGYDKVPNGLYRPHWFWYNASTGGAATYQYPYFGFHLTCPACATVGIKDITRGVLTTHAYPNPTNRQVTIEFDAADADEPAITITNLLGQQVTAPRIYNAIPGAITLNTAELAEGVYLYTLTANGNRFTGRIVVAH